MSAASTRAPAPPPVALHARSGPALQLSLSLATLHTCTHRTWPCVPLHGSTGLPERLEVALEGMGQSLVLGGFALGAMELDSALALAEHLAEDCAARPAAPERACGFAGLKQPV
ncbi:hypothetical protein ABPG77_004314 [Micractinium sp. CCAP 211/92]